MNLCSKIQERGFTALEMLLVTGLIILLLGGVVMIGFRDQAPKNRNAERKNEVKAMGDALQQWVLDNNSPSLPSVPLVETCIGTDASCYNLSQYLAPIYLNKIPEDPKSAQGQTNAGYTIVRDIVNKTITIKAPSAESGESISVQIKYGIAGAPNSSALKCASPQTFKKDGSGIPLTVQIPDYANFTPPPIVTVAIKFQEPVLGTCTAPTDAGGQHYLNHVSGTEMFTSQNYLVKFNRSIMESCVNTNDLLIVVVKNSGNQELFTCANKIQVVP